MQTLIRHKSHCKSIRITNSPSEKYYLKIHVYWPRRVLGIFLEISLFIWNIPWKSTYIGNLWNISWKMHAYKPIEVLEIFLEKINDHLPLRALAIFLEIPSFFFLSQYIEYILKQPCLLAYQNSWSITWKIYDYCRYQAKSLECWKSTLIGLLESLEYSLKDMHLLFLALPSKSADFFL